MNLLRKRFARRVLAAAMLLSACEDPVVAGPVAANSPRRPREQAEAPAAPAPEAAEPALPAIPSYDDDDFVELDVQNRDPFRSFVSAFAVRAAPQEVQRRVLLGNVAVDDMRLIAIVTGLSQPRAMLLDPMNVGWVVKRGDYIGRAEVLQAGGDEGVPVTLNWRVDRIRENELVLTREDPTGPNRPPLTRVIPLRPNEEPNPLLEQLDARGRQAANLD